MRRGATAPASRRAGQRFGRERFRPPGGNGRCQGGAAERRRTAAKRARPRNEAKGERKPRRRDGQAGSGQKPAFQAKPPREERPFQVDPLSPFAKLAALRDQLKK